MFEGTVLCVQRSEAIRFAARHLASLGITVTDKCAPDVAHLLLPVPSFPTGDTYLAHLLSDLPDTVKISGGNLTSPLLKGYQTVDFLQDPYYLADNAAITASCTIDILENRLAGNLSGKRALIIGWGRIGKCLGPMLKARNIEVSITARKSMDLAMIHALGYRPLTIEDAAAEIAIFDVILNTVPVLQLPDITGKTDSVILELASKPGVTGSTVIEARGLPGKMAPAKSGKLIADTFIRLSL